MKKSKPEKAVDKIISELYCPPPISSKLYELEKKRIEPIISQLRKQAIRETLEKVKLEKVDEDGDPDAPEFDQDYIKGKQYGWNLAIDQLTNLKKKLLEESEGK